MTTLIITFPDESWKAAFVAWMWRTAASDFIESQEADPLYGQFDNATLEFDERGGALTVQKDVYKDPAPGDRDNLPW